MKNEKDGGPAYPSRGGMMFYVPEGERGDVEKAIQALDQQYEGMTLRDHFAGLAMQSLILNPSPDLLNGPSWDHIIAGAYQAADAMLAERAK